MKEKNVKTKTPNKKAIGLNRNYYRIYFDFPPHIFQNSL